MGSTQAAASPAMAQLFADDAAAAQSVRLRRRQNVAINARAFERNFFVANEIIEMMAQRLAEEFCVILPQMPTET